MLTLMVDDPNPPCDAASVISPALSIFATSSRMVACSLTWSTVGSVVRENVVAPEPVKAARSELPLDPIDS